MTYKFLSHLIELDIFVLLNFQPYTVTQYMTSILIVLLSPLRCMLLIEMQIKI